MSEPSKKLRKMLREQAERAWEAEMRAALGALHGKFEQWKSGEVSSGDLDRAIHEYHNGIARDIWKRYSNSRPHFQVAYAVAAGLIAKDSLPPEVQEYIASLLGFYEDLDRKR